MCRCRGRRSSQPTRRKSASPNRRQRRESTHFESEAHAHSFPSARSIISGTLLGRSLTYRPVGEVEDARTKGLRVHELQRLLIALLLEEALPTPQNDGMNHEPKLVEAPVAQQR